MAPDLLDQTHKNAWPITTATYVLAYEKGSDAAKQKGVKTEANVVRAAVSDMHPDRAVVLVFVNQVTTSKDRPDPALATSSVMVTMVKNSGRWLISEFNPV